MSIQRSLKNSRPSPELIAAVLEEAGIGAVFGISGGHTGRIFGALEQRQQSIRTVLVREESLAAVMAEVYGRLTRKPGVVLGQGPWVLGNGLVGTIEARLSSSPMLLLTDFSDTPPFGLHAPYQSGTGSTEIGMRARPLAAWSSRCSRCTSRPRRCMRRSWQSSMR
ncbi:thiamine pyrophosphate-binding protein [Comamonas endophytica]|uniref:thiamine pyrophosphate-binding protein n=1 Tax=Comamonas endophytica TaxID=2949090 RepID=UPI003612524C